MPPVIARVENVAAAFGELLAEFDLTDDVDKSVAELLVLLTAPWAAFRAGSLRRVSALTQSGAPFELSVKLDGHGGVSLRYVVDVADHTLDLLGNVDRYLTAARSTTGLSNDALHKLFAAHLDAVPPSTPGTVMHGVGLASAGRRRSSLYFPASWLSPEELVRRLPRPMPAPNSAQVVGYDVEARDIAAWKTYHWLPVEPGTLLADHAEPEQQLPYAGMVYDRFAAGVPVAARGTSTFLQRKDDGRGRHDKLFFFSRPWGWADAAGLARLLRFLAESVAVDLGPLLPVSAAARRYDLPVQLGLVAVGGTGSPSLTFYFWPQQP